MIIDLKAIDEKGKDYKFDRLSDELKGAFDDLLGLSAFEVSLSISPMGNTYQVKGEINSQYLDTCSRCGYEVDVPLKGRINEIVVIEEARPRNTQVSQSQQNFDSLGPSVTYVNSPTLDLREFLHEMIVASSSLYPVCLDQEKCSEQQYKLETTETTPAKVGHPGFAALKNLKVNH